MTYLAVGCLLMIAFVILVVITAYFALWLLPVLLVQYVH
jgi:hypothetical protein